MDMVARQYTLDDRHAQFGADLADDIANAPSQNALEDLVAVFRGPDDVMPMVECRMCAGVECGHATDYEPMLIRGAAITISPPSPRRPELQTTSGTPLAQSARSAAARRFAAPQSADQ
jgi:hypothetical protein